MKLFSKITAVFDGTLALTNILAGVLLCFILLSVCSEVILRYFFESPTIWVIEISEAGLVYITFLGLAWVLKRGKHVSLDILVSRLKPRSQSLLGVFSSLVGAAAFLVVTWYGAAETWDHFVRGTFRSTLLEVPNAAILIIIPVGGFLLFIQFLREGYGRLNSLLGFVDRP
jgi:TRAP-type C4-dicarboxylate transport system permease small subunit